MHLKTIKKTAGVSIILIFILAMTGMNAYASNAGSIVTQKFNVLTDLITSIISAIGTIITLWGISEWGIALQSQDGTSQAMAFKRIAGGLVMLLAPQLISLFTL